MSSSSKVMLLLLALLAVSSTLCPEQCRCSKYSSSCSISSQKDLPRGLDKDTERLRVELYNIREINRNVTSQLQLPNLRELNLMKVSLETIRTASFLELGTLELLAITKNHIRIIETASFKTLHKLHTLDLSYNRIRDLQPGVFEGLDQLRHLDLSWNNLYALRKHYFDGMRRSILCNVTRTNSEINLSGNNIEHIESNTFEGLCVFKILNLEVNDLKEIKPNMFLGLSELKLLQISKLDESKATNSNVSINEVLNGLHKLERLSWENNDFTSSNLGATGFQGFESLTYLNLVSNSIAHLERGMLHGLRSVRTLILTSDQGLESLQGQVFHGAESVRKLKLFISDVSTLQADVFLGLNQLRFLDLTRTPIKTLTTQVFSHLVRLRELRIGSKIIHSIAPKTFSGLCSLKSLNVKNQILKTFARYTFSELARLDRLTWQYDQQSNTSQEIQLKGLQVVKSLDIHIHRASNVGSALRAVLKGVKFVQNLNLKVSGISLSHIGNMSNFNIKHLDMSHNNFSSLQGNYLSSLTTILSLDLSYCGIKEIQPTINFTKGALYGLVNLQKLDLTGNQLKTLESGTFQGLSKLLILIVSHCSIDIIKLGAFRGLNALQELDLSNNLMSSVTGDVFTELANIKKIDVSFSKVKFLDAGYLQGPAKLEHLELDYNTISILTPGTFSRYHNLKKLQIIRNGISSLVPGVFYGLYNIYEINLNGNKLTSLNPGVFGAECDQDFNITCESVSKLPHGPCNVTNALPTLQVLYLAVNNISYIHPHTFLYCNQLKKLYLINNFLLTLENNFLYIQALEELNMVSCGLTEIPPNSLECTPHLTTLDLSNNHLSPLNVTLFKELEDIQTVLLGKVVCDCDMRETWELLRHKKVRYTFICDNHILLKESEYFLTSLECNTSSSQLQEVEGQHKSPEDYLIFKQYIEPVILLIIFFCGLFGNGLLLYICLRYSDMRTATNVCVFNLAVSDLLSLIVNLPLSYWDVLHVRWELGLAMCQFFMMLKDLTVAVSVYSVVALALERYIVTLPRITHLPLCRIKTSVISLLWSFAISSSACAIWSARADIRCLYCPPDSVEYITRTWTIQLVVFCLIPATLIFILNGMTARNLYTSVRDRSAYIQEDQYSRGRKKLANMVVTLAFVFLLSYLPSFLLRVLVAWSVVHMEDVFFYSFVTYCFFFFNCLFNPISLFIISPQFKSHLLELVHIVTRDEPEPETDPDFVPVSDEEMKVEEVRKARMERLAKIGEKFQ